MRTCDKRATWLAIGWVAALATLPLPAGAGAPPDAAAWRAFFDALAPVARVDFVPLRGAFDPREGNYALKRPLDARLVNDCIILRTGAGDSLAWDLRCALTAFADQANGPATKDGPLVQMVGAALPEFRRGENLMGEPQWIGANRISVTVVFGGILIRHGYSD